MKTFEEQLNDKKAAVLADYSAAGTQMLLLFGGIKLGVGLPPFEFFRVLQDIPVKKLFLRDHRQAWYLRGVPSVGRSVLEIASWLRAEQHREGVTDVVAAGNSMGGFAALLYGPMLGATRVLAFSPQTFVSPRLLWRHRDRRWKWNRLRAWLGGQSKYFDLRPILEAHPQTQCDIHYCSKHRLDALHARHLEGLPHVRLHPSEEGGHRLIKTLRDNGSLRTILTQSLAHETSVHEGD